MSQHMPSSQQLNFRCGAKRSEHRSVQVVHEDASELCNKTENSSAKRIDALLPQTQCRECGYPDCKSYANALIDEKVSIGLCAPGGVDTLKKIGRLLDRDPQPYIEEAQKRFREPATVAIREEECIGCTKCIQACPVDAIIGAAKQMHTVLADECTGCGLCIAPCPVDCIEWIPVKKPTYDPKKAKQRYEAKTARHEETETQSDLVFQNLQQENLQTLLRRIKK